MSTALGTCCYAVRGLGEKVPVRVQLPCSSHLAAGVAICEEEIKLIAAAIRANKIPIPAALPSACPGFKIDVDCLEPADDVLKVFEYPPGHVTKRMRSPRVSLLDRLTSFMARERFAAVADKVVEIARGDTVLVIGERGRPAASLLCARGKQVAHLHPSRGDDSRLKDSRYRSILHWLCGGGEAASLGAVVLVGDHDFRVEQEALADTGRVPPIVRVTLDDKGTPSIEEVLLGQNQEQEAPWPKISVVTVSLNQAPYLEASIRSVLDQNYPNLEYIIVDGGSTDGSVEIIERYRDRCHTVIIEPDRGQSEALNKGFALTTGEIMNWLCSDDLLEPGSLKQVGRAYRRHCADLIVGGCIRIGDTRTDELYRHHTMLPIGATVKLMPLDILHFMRSWQAGNYFFQPEVFFSRRAWVAAGAYIKEHLFYAMDYDLWLRMALSGATARHVPAMIGCSRVHALQKTRDDRKYLHQMRQLMEEYKGLFQELQAAGSGFSTLPPQPS